MSSLLFLKFFEHRVLQNFAEKSASVSHYPKDIKLSLHFIKKGQLKSGIDNPSTDNQQPTTCNRQSATDNQQPTPDNRPSSIILYGIFPVSKNSLILRSDLCRVFVMKQYKNRKMKMKL